MLSGVKFRAYPGALKPLLRRWIGHQRFIVNAKVGEERYFLTFARFALSLTGQRPPADQAYSHFIGPDTEFLREVPSQVLRNGAYRFAQARLRHQRGLGGAAQIRNKSGRQSVLLTAELFEFSGEYCNVHTRKIERDLWLGTKKFPAGRLKFKAHLPYQVPQSVCISVEPSGEWYVSFCYERVALEGEAIVLRTQEELAYEFARRADLETLTEGFDRGSVSPLVTSEGTVFAVPAVNAKRIAQRERRIGAYQRRMARQQRGSKRRRKTASRLARLKAYGREVRRDFAHKTSATLVGSMQEILVFEDLKLKNLSAAPHPKKDAAGRWARNGSAAKAALTRGLISASLGQVLQFTRYKAAARNKLVLTVLPAYSSQECSACGSIDAANRRTQSEFRCLKCGFAANADHNAASVIKKRGIALLRSGQFRPKDKKTARVRGRNKVGQVLPKPEAIPTPEESTQVGVRGRAPARNALGSGKPPLQPVAASGR